MANTYITVNIVTGFQYVAVQVLLVLCDIDSFILYNIISSSINTVHAFALQYLLGI